METRTKISVYVFLILLLQIAACSKKPTDFRKFLAGSEIIYPGAANQTQVLPGNYRLELTWHPSADPSVAKYVVYWNNYADSLTVPATSHNPADTVKCLISKLQEYTYTFFINSYDNAGNKSISTEIDNARAYGSIYQASLINRPINRDTPYIYTSDSFLVLKFVAPDTINITTTINYTNMQGNAEQKVLPPAVDSVLITDYHHGTPVVYQSSYIPVRGAIDTFITTHVDTVPSIYRIIMCNKSLFKAVNLPHDLVAGFGTSLPQIWDGTMTPKGYPNIFHSDGSGNPPLPGTITMDMGATYNNLVKVEEIGRNCCHNPKEFEVWGIADTTGAISSLLPGNSGWKADMTAKGWAELGDFTRTDDGIAPYDALLNSNPPPVRFLIVRFVSDVDNSGYINLSQMTFWYKQ
ncbi:DUF4998 domain-containing protein [Puia dinghuensis]|uniref:DUF5000 domain-containing protein n=1 Tax=Puia dinghuensis TaxID=1792502 RepID=A0A8J2XTW1_9BACT|nr:DUF4998 domain-containing protein [Puia dinghuensis]GGB20872.1 hypothetical protein GCM10011511_50810 [Puia dinghuensis]